MINLNLYMNKQTENNIYLSQQHADYYEPVAKICRPWIS
jgi:hypothetical protein